MWMEVYNWSHAESQLVLSLGMAKINMDDTDSQQLIFQTLSAQVWSKLIKDSNLFN